MGRILPILALILAVGIAVVAVIELDSRSDDDDIALPTTLPSPTFGDIVTEEPTEEPAATDEVTEEPEGSVARSAAAVTDEPEPTETQQPAPTEEPQSTPTVAPPRTPTPEPAITVGPVDASRGNTPTTGASSVPAGTILAFAALALRATLSRRAR
jgi:serine/threonine-protein kinase